MQKSFGVFCDFEYNKLMKKSWRILLSMLMTVPMLVGMCFLTPNNAPATLNGGGGQTP